MDDHQARTYIFSWVEMIHDWAHKRGFYTNAVCHKPDGDPERDCVHRSGNILSHLMLIVTGLGEAVIAIQRNDLKAFRKEIADTVIRLFDLTGAYGIDLEYEIERRMSENFSRSYRHEEEIPDEKG